MSEYKSVSRFSRHLSLRILRQFLTASVIYFIAVLLIFFISQIMLTSKTWYGTETLYPLFRFISLNRVAVIVGVAVIGILIIFLPFWFKTLGYLEDVIYATEIVHTPDDRLVSLPSELIEVEKQLNQIKLNIQRSEGAAREAEQRKNDLVVYLAHDLKTPLTSVIGYLSLLKDEPQISDELRQRYLGISISKAERLEELINEFFDITRFNLTNPTLECSKVNLTRMLEQVAFEFAPLFKEKNLNCDISTPTDLMLCCDSNKLQRAFDNLFRNACSYSYADSTITVSIVQQDKQISIRFQNHGNTIPEDKLVRLFDQFYRLDSARSSQSGGTGLGLAITREIVQLHGGSIHAFSKDELVVFEIMLPLL